jgi:hypothetical protein
MNKATRAAIAYALLLQGLAAAGCGDRVLERYFLGRSINTTSEFWRERSNTRYFPSGVMSK